MLYSHKDWGTFEPVSRGGCRYGSQKILKDNTGQSGEAADNIRAERETSWKQDHEVVNEERVVA